MRSARKVVTAAFSAIILAGLTGCAVNEAPGFSGGESQLSGTLNGAGSSAQGSAQEAWIAAFQGTSSGLTVNYDPSGSGAGRKAFISGGVQFAGSDSALSDDELTGTFAMCATGTSAINIPVYNSPIAVVFNVEGVDDLNLDAETVAKVFSGAITQWNDPAIVALNPGAKLPAATITAVHRSDDSGTTKNFTDYLSKAAPEAWTSKPDGKWPLEGGEGANGTSGLIDTVTNGSNTIGYADLSKAGKLGIAKLKVGDAFVAPSAEAAAAALAGSEKVSGRADNDLTFKINRTTTDSKAYPLVLVSYLIVCQQYADAEVGKLVNAYASFLVSSTGQLIAAGAAGSAPLTGDIEKEAIRVAASIQ
ncbi:MAG TPA: phosphate ABC transporter substrate-binding protein PstS [Microbacteriaceae bacterium]|nr:phosphate ABC transporter substrate-binding protein PstS [Microbacteriaceae bacterium]